MLAQTCASAVLLGPLRSRCLKRTKEDADEFHFSITGKRYINLLLKSLQFGFVFLTDMYFYSSSANTALNVRYSLILCICFCSVCSANTNIKPCITTKTIKLFRSGTRSEMMLCDNGQYTLIGLWLSEQSSNTCVHTQISYQWHHNCVTTIMKCPLFAATISV